MGNKVETERTVFTFAVLYAAGWHVLQDGTARRKGSFYEWMTANAFAAFSLEAYLNHLGPRRFKCWEKLEHLPVESKLALLLEDLNQRPTWLDLAHRRLDEAVLDAYSWPHDLTDEGILERLLSLNLERAAAKKTS